MTFFHPDLMPLYVFLNTPGEDIVYLYDFGDRWEHEIRLMDMDTDTAEAEMFTCIDGGGACPPEDIGGTMRYNELLEDIKTAVGKNTSRPIRSGAFRQGRDQPQTPHEVLRLSAE